ncbi:unnamed protein product [Dovyalis caffra]|uniref:Uncharacterized protein n=1 Tax=Dovyalis caffra TaxID=77055 RepID=A0AAV1RBW4_9ROSI|nr:unnamed protein product [Dovyalis caffra]
MAEQQNQTDLSPFPPPLQQPLHQSDADEDDDTVKQLKQCSSLYLSLQKLVGISNDAKERRTFE